MAILASNAAAPVNVNAGRAKLFGFNGGSFHFMEILKKPRRLAVHRIYVRTSAACLCAAQWNSS
jgi:hypothetical protein